MGGGIIGIVLVVVLLVVLLAVVFFVIPLARKREHQARAINEPHAPTLDYHVPEGQDPAAVMAALSHEGYDAALDPHDTQLLRVHCPAGPDRDRARVRSVIEQVPATGIDGNVPLETHRIHFADEA